MKRVLRWLAPLLVAGATALPVSAQFGNPPQDPTEYSTEPGPGHTPALQYTLAFLFVAAVLVLICKPSRKA
jgi:hypothetical protein